MQKRRSVYTWDFENLREKQPKIIHEKIKEEAKDMLDISIKENFQDFINTLYINIYKLLKFILESHLQLLWLLHCDSPDPFHGFL